MSSSLMLFKRSLLLEISEKNVSVDTSHVGNGGSGWCVETMVALLTLFVIVVAEEFDLFVVCDC